MLQPWLLYYHPSRPHSARNHQPPIPGITNLNNLLANYT